jgi:SAM-dependent MidA family methyltransferase
MDTGAFNHPALDWLDDVAGNVQRGYVIAIDYGRLGDEFQANIQLRAQNRNLYSPQEQIGHADITMQVDWLSIVERARANGLHVAGFTDQHHFLTGIISELGRVDSSQSFLPDSPKTTRELQTLLQPEMLGRGFQVLALEKNVGAGATCLAGFKFAREPRFCVERP